MCEIRHWPVETINLYSNKMLALTFSSFSKCSRRNFIGRSGLVMQRLTMHSFRICWMLCFCTNTSQPFKLSSSSRLEEVAILSFKSVARGKNRVDQGNLSGGEKGGTVLGKKRTCDIQHDRKKKTNISDKWWWIFEKKNQADSCQGPKTFAV